MLKKPVNRHHLGKVPECLLFPTFSSISALPEYFNKCLMVCEETIKL